MAKIDNLFLTKTAKIAYIPFGTANTYVVKKGNTVRYPSHGALGSLKQIASGHYDFSRAGLAPGGLAQW